MIDLKLENTNTILQNAIIQWGVIKNAANMLIHMSLKWATRHKKVSFQQKWIAEKLQESILRRRSSYVSRGLMFQWFVKWHDDA